MSDKVRINYVIHKKQAEEIKIIMEEAGVATQRELFDNAITFLKWGMKKKKEGKTVGSVDKKGETFTELEMPVLEHAAIS